jgi:hypothetical protein
VGWDGLWFLGFGHGVGGGKGGEGGVWQDDAWMDGRMDGWMDEPPKKERIDGKRRRMNESCVLLISFVCLLVVIFDGFLEPHLYYCSQCVGLQPINQPHTINFLWATHTHTKLTTTTLQLQNHPPQRHTNTHTQPLSQSQSHSPPFLFSPFARPWVTPP